MCNGHQRFGFGGWIIAATWLACATLPAVGQIYTFTSGPGGDGFNWPASPTGLLDGNAFSTSDGVEFYNDTGNSLFFDSQYQVVGNGSRISGDALWGNPLDNGFSSVISLDFYGIEDVQDIDFDFAWSQAGVPAVSDFISFYAEDSDGRSTFGGWSLSDTFIGLGGSTGYEGSVSLSASLFQDDDNNVDGGPFIDIAYLDIFLDDIVIGGSSSEFAIDNLNLDGSNGGGPSEVYPSVNGGQFDVTGSVLGGSSLRGTGTFGSGIEVTNSAANSTTYSTELVPGGDLTSGTHPNGDVINAGQSIFSSNVATIDRSLPSGVYDSDIRIINDGDPTDPDNVSTLRISLYEPQSLTGNFAGVDVSAGQQITLTNAAAPANGFRAAVEVTASQTTGPFEVTNFAIDTAVKDGETAQTNVGFNRYGQLSGTRTGTYTVSLQMTAFVGTNNTKIFLANNEPVPDQVWDLNYNNVDATTDNANISTGFSYLHIVGVNTFDVAATLIDGTSSKNQNVGMQITSNPDPTSADLIGDAVDLIFGGGAGDQYVLQLTYNDGALPSGITESQLQLLVYDTVVEEWEAAEDGNTTGDSTFFNGSYEDYLAGPGGGVFDAGDLGFFGLDTVNNRVWAILDHASIFAVGVLTAGTLGDFDGDGDVDGADFLTWQRDLNVGDLADWESAYGTGGGTGVAAVPEPTSLAFVIVCLVMISTGSRAALTR